MNESYEISDTAVAQRSVANDAVTSLTEAVNRIGEIVGLINDIAEKTNLLALNATIEAAWDAEAGRGFAVVAAEVKELAGQTAKATSEIGDQSQDTQEAADQSASAIESVNQTIERRNEISASIAAAVEQQKESTGEISKSVQAASSGTRSVTGSIAGISDASTQVSCMTDIVRTSAEDLGRHTKSLRADAQQFMKILAQAVN
ncbi:methyl-accepting chemotaxis protein [uncultured Roseibium sp.]|uniref:methyl-accepting chemotaxis protein n=1 Tax=uncultured Roseibium sp. TaxID=1936171 RepID=UPI003217C9C4